MCMPSLGSAARFDCLVGVSLVEQRLALVLLDA